MLFFWLVRKKHGFLSPFIQQLLLTVTVVPESFNFLFKGAKLSLVPFLGLSALEPHIVTKAINSGCRQERHLAYEEICLRNDRSCNQSMRVQPPSQPPPEMTMIISQREFQKGKKILGNTMNTRIKKSGILNGIVNLESLRMTLCLNKRTEYSPLLAVALHGVNDHRTGLESQKREA